MVNSAYTQKFVFVPSPQPDFHQLVGGLGMRLEFLVDFFPRKHLYIHTRYNTCVFDLRYSITLDEYVSSSYMLQFLECTIMHTYKTAPQFGLSKVACPVATVHVIFSYTSINIKRYTTATVIAIAEK